MPLYGASLLVLVTLCQGAFSQTETHMHGETVRHKITTKTKLVEKGGHCPLVHTALWRAPHAFWKWEEWHDHQKNTLAIQQGSFLNEQTTNFIYYYQSNNY